MSRPEFMVLKSSLNSHEEEIVKGKFDIKMAF
jgi:hypothetical protein